MSGMAHAHSTSVLRPANPRRQSPARRVLWRSLFACLPSVWGREGLEIGGPSGVFRRSGILPLYPWARRVDNVNFATQTIWSEAQIEGAPYVFDTARAPGMQRIAEAGRLHGCADAAFDFLLASHVLEHLANPLAALAEWSRVLKVGGLLVLVLPHRQATFDHRRPVTSLQHLREDAARAVDESDLTHLEEILLWHDLARDPGAGDFEAFALRSRGNALHRCLHHHVFDTALALAMVDAAGWQVRTLQWREPHHIVLVLRKPAAAAKARNAAWLRPQARWRAASPFSTDRP